jgi:hypothetical protein
VKINDWHIAPNPRRLHICLAEKGLDPGRKPRADVRLPCHSWYCVKLTRRKPRALELWHAGRDAAGGRDVPADQSRLRLT